MSEREVFEVEALGHVVGGRVEPTDDYWGGTRSIIRLDSDRFTADATKGLEDFSHLEIVFRLRLTDPTDLNLGARRPRDNPDWPEVGIFGHRNMRRLNWLGVSRCRLLKIDGLDLHVEDLDAVDGTPRSRHQALVHRLRTTRRDPPGHLDKRNAWRLLRPSPEGLSIRWSDPLSASCAGRESHRARRG